MFHLHLRYISKASGSSASAVMNYIARTGRYANRGDKVREVITMNLPEWAIKDNGAAYWLAADSSRSRANARQGYVVEYALSKLLTHDEQRALATLFAAEVSALCADGVAPHGAVPLMLGIHEGYGRNPHCHLLLSSSINDGIGRAPRAWFMRHNPNVPEKGGAKRSRIMAKKKWLIAVRELWATLANSALVAAGHAGTMDHRSNKTRGLIKLPGLHLGPSAAHLQRNHRPAPRVRRFAAMQLQNAALEAWHQDVISCRLRVKTLEAEEVAAAQDYRDWIGMDQARWSAVFKDHPLAGDSATRVEMASVFVLESDRTNFQAVYEVSRDPKFLDRVARKVSPTLDLVTTSEGMWLVRPDAESVVFLGSGYAVTDGFDIESIDGLIAASSMLPHRSPTVWGKSSILETLSTRLQRLGVSWPVRPIGAMMKKLLATRL